MRTASLAVVLGLVAACLVLATPASAAPQCNPPGNVVTVCSNDPNCPARTGGYGTGVYVLGKWFACTTN